MERQPYHDIDLTNYTHIFLRVFILPNAWICAKIYTDDSRLIKQTTFSFPRISRVLGDSSVKYELGEWNNDAMRKNYDALSIGMVLAELAGDETALRNLKEIHIEGRDARVLKCLQAK